MRNLPGSDWFCPDPAQFWGAVDRRTRTSDAGSAIRPPPSLQILDAPEGGLRIWEPMSRPQRGPRERWSSNQIFLHSIAKKRAHKIPCVLHFAKVGCECRGLESTLSSTDCRARGVGNLVSSKFAERTCFSKRTSRILGTKITIICDGIRQFWIMATSQLLKE